MKVRRYFRMEYHEPTISDVVWYDRRNGKVIMCYDALDTDGGPFNTEDAFKRRGLDVFAMTKNEKCAVKQGAELAHHNNKCMERYGQHSSAR